MSIDYTGRSEGLHAAQVVRSNWILFILLGTALMVAGGLAIVVPAVSEMPASKALGGVLTVSGILQIFQSSKVLHWTGFMWHLLLGILAVIGGALIYLDPFAGIVTITILIAIVFAIHGVTQIAFALKVRRQSGWQWFLLSGCVSLVISVLLVMKLPYNHSFTPATLGGVSLLFAGWAFIAIALASRRTGAGS